MLNIAKQTLDFYLQNNTIPTIKDIEISDENLLVKQGNIFVTLYKKWDVRGSAGNIKEIKPNLIEEIIANTITAASQDKRFTPVNLGEVKELKIRLDRIIDRKILGSKELEKVDPVKSGIITIKKDYSKLAVILPNMNPKILTWDDYKEFLDLKLNEKFREKDYIIYAITTETFQDY